FSERKQAKLIGCSWTTWRRTVLYAEARRKRNKQASQSTGTKNPGPRPAVNFTKTLEATVGVGQRDEVLNQLIQAGPESAEQKNRTWEDLSPQEQQALINEQEKDFEPSPLDQDLPGSPPKKVRTHKRL